MVSNSNECSTGSLTVDELEQFQRLKITECQLDSAKCQIISVAPNGAQVSAPSIDRLVNCVWVEILKFLSVSDTARLSQTSKSLQSIAQLWMGEYELNMSILPREQRACLTDQALNGFVRSVIKFCKVINFSGTQITDAGVLQLAKWGVTRLIITGCPNIKPLDVAWGLRKYSKTHASSIIDIDVYMQFRAATLVTLTASVVRECHESIRIHRVLCEELSVNVCDPALDPLECHHCDTEIPWLHRCANCVFNIHQVCLRDGCLGCPANPLFRYNSENGKGVECRECAIYFCSLCMRGITNTGTCTLCQIPVQPECRGIDRCKFNNDVCPICKIVVCMSCATNLSLSQADTHCVRFSLFESAK